MKGLKICGDEGYERRTDGDVLVGGLSATEVVLGEELRQHGLDAAQRLVLSVEQHDQI